MPTEKKRILVVDDEPSNSQLVKLYLEQTNDHVVREENDPKVAVAAAEEFQPDLILLDLRMPGMDGRELASSFAEHPKLKTVPIVFLTAAITRLQARAVHGQIGKYPFLAKPLVLPELVACLQQQLGK